jgi:hypothetical protein
MFLRPRFQTVCDGIVRSSAVFAILCKQPAVQLASLLLLNRELDSGNVFVELMEQINEVHVTRRVTWRRLQVEQFDFHRDESRREQLASFASFQDPLSLFQQSFQTAK